MQLALSEARNKHNSDTSSTIPALFRGIDSIHLSNSPEPSLLVISVSIKPGAIALHLIFLEANSSAIDFVKPFTPAFDAAQFDWPALPFTPTIELILIITPSFFLINSLTEHLVKLKQEFKEFKSKDEDEKRREQKFSEKIDELNQETDSLLDEIEKWQM